ncbi:MAG: IS66 family transposase, partial [Planctomycetota bacterium]
NRYLENGECNIDNNFIERAMRHSAVGRKNWLFVGSEAGGETCATLSSLIYSAKLQKLNLFAYMRDVLAKIPATPLSELNQLLPHRWKLATR